jgi:retron-type reverse transcriptase
VVDRVAQTVAVLALEPAVEKVFHEDSYGYVCPEQEGSLM